MGKQKKDLTYVHVAIGVAIMILFWVIPPIEPITALGMKCVGSFLGMVYMWSTVESLWPSLLGLVLIALSGYAGEGMKGFNAVFASAFGTDTVLLTMFSMVLFGGLDVAGVTKYIAKWFLTRKVFKGRPYIFLAVFYLCCFAVSALVSPITGLMILWPVALGLMETMGIKREDKIWSYIFVGMFLFSTLGQPYFPFRGAQLVPLSAFKSMTEGMGNPMEVPTGAYMIVALIMPMLIMLVYLIGIRLIRVDVGKLKNVDPEQIEQQMQLPPMNFQQKAYLYMVPAYLLMLLVPNFIKGNPVCDFLNTLGSLGVTVIWVVIFCCVRWNGAPLLVFKEVAYKQFNWGIFFMIGAAVYGANTLSNASTGVTDFLIQTLNPILGGKPEMVFVAIMFTVALIITNFANNAAMAVVLLPVVISFSGQLGIDPIPVVMGVVQMVFVAMLTPAASPHAGLMHGRKDIYSTGEIMKIGFPMCIITLIMWIFIGYPLCKFLV